MNGSQSSDVRSASKAHDSLAKALGWRFNVQDFIAHWLQSSAAFTRHVLTFLSSALATGQGRGGQYEPNDSA